MRATADRLVYFPMHGFADSLNVSVAAALCLFSVLTLYPDVSNRASGWGDGEKEVPRVPSALRCIPCCHGELALRAGPPPPMAHAAGARRHELTRNARTNTEFAERPDHDDDTRRWCRVSGGQGHETSLSRTRTGSRPAGPPGRGRRRASDYHGHLAGSSRSLALGVSRTERA
jgi:hypothetical protein